MTDNALEKHVLNLVCSVFDAYSAVLFQPMEGGDACKLAAWFSLGDKIASDASILPGKGIVGWIIRNREPILHSHFDQRQFNLGYYVDDEEASIKAFMGCPVPAGGALCVDSKRKYSFSDKDYKILQLFAELVSRQQSVGHVHESPSDIPRYFAGLGIIQDLRFRYSRWPEFLQDYLRTVVQATEFDYGVFASADATQETYHVEYETRSLLLESGQTHVLPMDNGIVGWVFRNGQPVVTEGIQGSPTSMIFGKLPESAPSFQSVICEPVTVNKTVRGVVCLAHGAEKRIDEAMRSFVRQAVDHLALFLENLYLKNRLRSVLPKARVHNQGAHAYDPDRDYRAAAETNMK
ncbi:MAG: GAF domain-containing protein [Desulfovibrio sp.]|jgi:signal transduction protein with GAF and PtsI domain|nr:GAF domain-containing protein [Desulfovibrio sp.]